MSPNLRTVFRPLLQPLGMAETEFWELERAGRLAGLFETGRTGPGGGTPGTRQAVTMAVIALMAGITKREGARLATTYGAANYEPLDSNLSEQGRCDLTGATSFVEALTTILSAPSIAARVRSIGINHAWGSAWIKYHPDPARHSRYPRGKNAVAVSHFGARAQGGLRSSLTEIENPFFTLLAERLEELADPAPPSGASAPGRAAKRDGAASDPPSPRRRLAGRRQPARP